ncbi:MAG: DNA alkylation repair protein [Candidatus Omnitrophica bacterium]|nr:DNA alkylation repair protein [Candidatus Omnitrophota bacterium]
MSLPALKRELRRYRSKEKARLLQGFFKTGPGEYGEGDVFLGVMVPFVRKVVRQYRHLCARETLLLLKSPFHEERLSALLIMVSQFEKGDERVKKQIYQRYLKNTRFINNWDLVDLTARQIVGAYLTDKDRAPLYGLARSKNLWERRIAVIATAFYIAKDEFKDTFCIARLLLNDRHDLIHKAVGWMLREVGKRNMPAEEAFLKKNHKKMPRTMLRYAIEKFPENKRKTYLKNSL